MHGHFSSGLARGQHFKSYTSFKENETHGLFSKTYQFGEIKAFSTHFSILPRVNARRKPSEKPAKLDTFMNETEK